MKNFKELTVAQSGIDPFELKDKWMLITAQKDGKVNTMTASWGGFGIMWHKEIAFVVIRPQRYTKEFVDAADSFSLTFFDNSYKKQLGYLGQVSGRDEDKISKSNLTVAHHNDIPYFEEAQYVIFAKKLYAQPMAEEFFIDQSIIEKWYPKKDFHILYFAEINEIFSKI